MSGNRKTYGRPRHRVAYNSVEAAAADLKLAHKEIVAALEWLERGHLITALDRAHLANRFIEDTLIREGRIEEPESEDEQTD